jgi:hypothetical protein
VEMALERKAVERMPELECPEKMNELRRTISTMQYLGETEALTSNRGVAIRPSCVSLCY